MSDPTDQTDQTGRLGPADPLLERAARLATAHLRTVADRPVLGTASVADLRHALGGPLPAVGAPAEQVLDALVAGAAGGIVGSAGPRYFGFVTGGSLPPALAADWLASAWDQNVALGVMSPAAAVTEEVVGGWLADLLGVPPTASFGLVTGAQMANVVGLAAARHHVLAAAGVDVAEVGLAGAGPLRVIVGAERHTTVDVALRYLGIGRRQLVVVPADEAGRMLVDELAAVLGSEPSVPTIVCAQAGCVNTGASDPIGAISDAAHRVGAWVHVDGAFGLWAAASPRHRHLVDGHERADSWATDAHKWLNVPYDAGLVFVAHPEAHRAAMAMSAAYLVRGDEADALRDGSDWAPESSRRARAFAIWAALRSLGRDGVAELVARCCDLAAQAAEGLAAIDGVEVILPVELNQVLVRFAPDDDRHRRIHAAIQAEGTVWFGGTVWQGRPAARISISGWATTGDDIDALVDIVRRAASA